MLFPDSALTFESDTKDVTPNTSISSLLLNKNIQIINTHGKTINDQEQMASTIGVLDSKLIPPTSFKGVEEYERLNKFAEVYKAQILVDLQAMNIDHVNWPNVKIVPTKYLIEEEGAAGTSELWSVMIPDLEDIKSIELREFEQALILIHEVGHALGNSLILQSLGNASNSPLALRDGFQFHNKESQLNAFEEGWVIKNFQLKYAHLAREAFPEGARIHDEYTTIKFNRLMEKFPDATKDMIYVLTVIERNEQIAAGTVAIYTGCLALVNYIEDVFESKGIDINTLLFQARFSGDFSQVKRCFLETFGRGSFSLAFKTYLDDAPNVIQQLKDVAK